MKVTVAALVPEDRDSWQALYYGYADFYQTPMDQTILDTVWGWIFDEDQRFFALMAKDEQGHGVGLMHYREMVSPLRGAAVGFLDDLYIDPDCRGAGIVDRLFETLHAAAQAQGWPFVRWITAEDNHRARAVYDRLSDKTHWITYQVAVN